MYLYAQNCAIDCKLDKMSKIGKQNNKPKCKKTE